MGSDHKPVTLRQIAKTAGVSHATVSLALRHARKIPATTRQRILEISSALGYRQNPAVAAWMADRRAKRRTANEEIIMYLNPFENELDWNEMPSITRFHAGAKRRAEELGFTWDDLWFRRQHMTVRRVGEVLRARGVRAVIVGSSPIAQSHMPLKWEFLIGIAQGLTLVRSNLSRTCNNYAETAINALRSMRLLGYDKIALVIAPEANARCGALWLAGYLVYVNRVAAAQQPPPFIADDWSPESFWRWYQQLSTGSYPHPTPLHHKLAARQRSGARAGRQGWQVWTCTPPLNGRSGLE